MSDLYIGLMSGSSLDGIDAVLVDFATRTPRLKAQHHHPIEPGLAKELDALTRPGENELQRLCQADVRFGETLASAVQALLQQAQLRARDIHAIGSHGHTLRHYPDSPTATTLQIGDANRIAERTGITTVADMRRRDMAAGGQGAPLVPAFHQAVFSLATGSRVILNIGGIANLTLLPGSDSGQAVRGFDTGPGNALLDAWITRHRQQPFDHDGQWAASGMVDAVLLAKMKQDAYFSRPAPKSTGRDRFNLDWLEDKLKGGSYAAADVQATLLELTASSIADALEAAAFPAAQVLVCGGGAHNRAMMARLQAHLPQRNIDSSRQAGIEPDWVEAMAFAWMAQQTLRHQPANLPSVTGAAREVILGAIYPA